MQRSLLDPVCNVPVSGESRETKGWPPVSLWNLRKEWPIWQYREVGHVYTLTKPSGWPADSQKDTKSLVIPMVPLKACWLNHTEMSCYFSYLSALTGRGELKESLKLGFLSLLPVGTLDLLWAAYQRMQKCLKVTCSQTSSQTGMSVRDILLNWSGKDPTP